MPDEIVLNESAHAIWQELASHGPLEVAALVERTGVDQAQIAAAAAQAEERGFFDVTVQPREELTPSDSALAALEVGLPERRAAKYLAEVGGELPLPDFIKWAKSAEIAPKEVLIEENFFDFYGVKKSREVKLKLVSE